MTTDTTTATLIARAQLSTCANKGREKNEVLSSKVQKYLTKKYEELQHQKADVISSAIMSRNGMTNSTAKQVNYKVIGRPSSFRKKLYTCCPLGF